MSKRSIQAVNGEDKVQGGPLLAVPHNNLSENKYCNPFGIQPKGHNRSEAFESAAKRPRIIPSEYSPEGAIVPLKAVTKEEEEEEEENGKQYHHHQEGTMKKSPSLKNNEECCLQSPELWLSLICGIGGGFGETFDRMINVSKEMRSFFLDRRTLKRVVDCIKDVRRPPPPLQGLDLCKTSLPLPPSENGGRRHYILPKWFFCPIPLKELRPLGVLYGAVWNNINGTSVVERVEEVDCTSFWDLPSGAGPKGHSSPISFECLKGVVKWGVEDGVSMGAYVNGFSTIPREDKLKIREGNKSLGEYREESFLDLMEDFFLDEVLLDEGVVNPHILNHLKDKDTRMAAKATTTTTSERQAFLNDKKNQLKSFFRETVAPKLLEFKDEAMKKGREENEYQCFEGVDDANLLLTGGYAGFYMLQKRPKSAIKSPSFTQNEEEEVVVEKRIYPTFCCCLPTKTTITTNSADGKRENHHHGCYSCINPSKHDPLVRDWKGKDVDLWIQTPLFDGKKCSRSNSKRVNSWEGKGGGKFYAGLSYNTTNMEPTTTDQYDKEEMREEAVQMARYDEVDRRMFPEWTEKIPPSLALECIYTEEGEDLLSTISGFDICNVAWGWLYNHKEEEASSLLYCTPLALCAWEWDEVYVAPTGKNISYLGRSKLNGLTTTKTTTSSSSRETNTTTTEGKGEFTGDYIEWSIKRHDDFCIPFIIESLESVGLMNDGGGGGNATTTRKRSVNTGTAAAAAADSTQYHRDYHKCESCNTPLLEELLESIGELKASSLCYDDIPLLELTSPTENAYRKERGELLLAMEEALSKWKKDRICKYDERFKKQREEGRWHYLHCPLAYNW